MQLQENLNIRIHLLFRLAEIIDDGDNFFSMRELHTIVNNINLPQFFYHGDLVLYEEDPFCIMKRIRFSCRRRPPF